jgi:hypothetical protein
MENIRCKTNEEKIERSFGKPDGVGVLLLVSQLFQA